MKNNAIQLTASSQQPGVLVPVFDLKYDVEGKIVSGLVVGHTQPQNEALILAANPGEFKNAIGLGVGLDDALLSEGELLNIRHLIRSSYAMDGLEIQDLDVFDLSKIRIKAKYQ